MDKEILKENAMLTERQRIFNELAKRADRLNSVADVCLDEIARLRYIEAEVLQAQAPVSCVLKIKTVQIPEGFSMKIEGDVMKIEPMESQEPKIRTYKNVMKDHVTPADFGIQERDWIAAEHYAEYLLSKAAPQPPSPRTGR